MLYTSPPNFYLSPSEKEIREMAERLQIENYPEGLARDLAHKAAGGEMRPESDWYDHVRQAVAEVGGNIEKTIQYHRNICDFLRGLDFENIPGHSPLEQAMNVLKLLSQHEGGEPENETAPVPIFCEDATDGNETAETLNTLMETVETLDPEEQMLIQETPEPSEVSGVGSDSDMKKMALAEDMDERKRIWLEVSRNLDASSKLQVRKSVKLIPDREGDEVRVRPIANLSELPKIQTSEYLLPETYRHYRAAAKVSTLRERVRRVEKQQLLYILIDTSGSMEGSRMYQAGGVLMNRLKAVISGDAQVYARFFDTKLHEEHYASSPDAAKALMREFQEYNFTGDGTRITESLKGAQERIEGLLKSGEALTRPELVIVTDGQDRNVSELDRADFGLTRVHAFVIDNSDTRLVEFARSTGGVGVQIEAQEDDIPF